MPGSGFAADRSIDRLRGEFWIRADLLEIVSPGSQERDADGFSERERRALETLLEDARWVFSGMIYGYSFAWTPPSRARAVDEELLIEPLALIPRGDERLRTVSITSENGFIYVTLEYIPDESQKARLRGWAGNRFPSAGGQGTARIGPESVRRAIEAAIREAVRSYLRAREYNRPRVVKGRLAFQQVPVTGLSGSGCRAEVKLRLDLEELRAYGAD